MRTIEASLATCSLPHDFAHLAKLRRDAADSQKVRHRSEQVIQYSRDVDIISPDLTGSAQCIVIWLGEMPVEKKHYHPIF